MVAILKGQNAAARPTAWSNERKPCSTRQSRSTQSFGDAYLQLGNLEYARHNLATAIDDYKKAIDVKPELVDAHYRLAVAYDRTGEKEKAAQEFQLHDELKKQQAAEIEQQRREVKQFLVNGQPTFLDARAKADYFTGALRDATIPAPSRMVRIWFALICSNRSIFCVVGHFTSIASTVLAMPRPK